MGSAGKIVAPPKTVAQTIDSIIGVAIAPYNDSVAAAAQKRDPTDWTVNKGGYKWGIDRQAIRLGPVSIPTALLAMLPLNLQGNPVSMERDRSTPRCTRHPGARPAGVNDADFMKAGAVSGSGKSGSARRPGGSTKAKDGSGATRRSRTLLKKRYCYFSSCARIAAVEAFKPLPPLLRFQCHRTTNSQA